MKETILITGGVGFLGTNIAIEASNRGHGVVTMDNFSRAGTNINAQILHSRYGVSIMHGDVRVPSDFGKLPKVDAIIHLAGQPGIPMSLAHPRLDFETNALGTLNVLEYARSHGKIPVLYASTNKIYSDGVNNLPLTESGMRYEFADRLGVSETFPMDSAGEHSHSPYGVSKAAGDLLCQEYYHAFGVPTVVFRMSCIYGLYQHGVAEQGWVDHFVRQKVLGGNRLTLYGNGKQVRDCLFGSDTANAYLTALNKLDQAKGQVFNLGGGRFNTSLLEFIDLLNCYPTRTGERSPIKVTHKDWRLADHRCYISDTTRIQDRLGWEPVVPIKYGIDQMIAAYRGELYET